MKATTETTATRPDCYEVYCTLTPTVSGHEGTRKTLHNARRLAASLRRAGLDTCVAANRGGQLEVVESVDLSKYLATARGEEIAELVAYHAS